MEAARLNMVLSIIILFSIFSTVFTQEGIECATPNKLTGVCINIKKCKPLIELLKTQSRNYGIMEFLRQSSCGYIGSTPLVCCPGVQTGPSSATPITSTSTSTTTTTTTTTTTSTFAPDLKPKTSDYLLPSYPECSFVNISVGRIVGGTPAKPGEFPWMAALGFRNARNPSQPKWLCGGSLITRRHVLTAAHCAIRQDLYLVRLGAYDLYDEKDTMEPIDLSITNVKLHEGYVNGRYENDIAILTLEQEAFGKNIEPICLPTSDTFRARNLVSKNVIVSGWGSIYFRGPSSSILNKVILPVVDKDTCATAFSKVNGAVIDDRVVCVGKPGNGQDSCQGDSGGPLMFPINQNVGETTLHTYYLIGVVSYGIRCADPKYYGVYTRTSTFLEWIEQNLQS